MEGVGIVLFLILAACGAPPAPECEPCPTCDCHEAAPVEAAVADGEQLALHVDELSWGACPPGPLSEVTCGMAVLEGSPREFSEWDGSHRILNFWATWCAPCRREIPALIALQHQYPEQLQLLGLAFDSPQNLSAFSGEFDFNYPLLLVQTESAQLNRYFGNSHSGLPFTAVLNADRDIVYRHAGEISKQQLEQAILPLLEPVKAS